MPLDPKAYQEGLDAAKNGDNSNPHLPQNSFLDAIFSCGISAVTDAITTDEDKAQAWAEGHHAGSQNK